MFRGNHPTRVDEKGRLKVPAEFKRVIDEKYGTQFYITSLDGKVAQVYPFEEWERIEQKLAGLSTFNPTKKKFLDRMNYWGQQVEMDGQGRLLMPQLLRESAQIKGEVAVTGISERIWKCATWKRTARRSRRRSSRLRMRRRSTNWASSGRGFQQTPLRGLGMGEVGHVPVLLKEAIDFLAVRRGGTYIDATVGLGGHSYEIAKRLGAPGHLIGFDKDPAALEIARESRQPSVVGRQRKQRPDERLADGRVAAWFVCRFGQRPTTSDHRRSAGRPRRQQSATRRRRARL